MVPIIGLAGVAGAGKDSFGKELARLGNGVCIAQADPLKQMIFEIFGFPVENLWGPSALRNVPLQPVYKPMLVNKWANILFPGVGEARADLEHIVKEWMQADKLLTVRKVAQWLGTQWAREREPDIWANIAIKNAKRLLGSGCVYDPAQGLVRSVTFPGYDLVVVTDLRFRNECLAILSTGGVTMKITRPDNALAEEACKAGIQNHASEKELDSVPHYLYSYEIMNDTDLEGFLSMAPDLLGDMFAAKVEF